MTEATLVVMRMIQSHQKAVAGLRKRQLIITYESIVTIPKKSVDGLK